MAAKKPENPLLSIKYVGLKHHILDDAYHYLLKTSWLSLIGVLLTFFFLIILIFALLYSLDPGCLANTKQETFNDSFVFSLQTLTTIGYGNFYPANFYSEILVFFEAFCGLFIQALSAGLMFAKFSIPKSQIVFSKYAVVNSRNGLPTLNFRVANERRNQIVDTQIKVVLSMSHITKEGEWTRKLTDLSLLRQSTPIFGLTWSIYHTIDANSPLFGKEHDELEKLEATIFISLVGIDSTSGQTIHAQHLYSASHVIWNRRLADIIQSENNKIKSVNFLDFHNLAD